jgi:hypothetical protein
MLATVSRSVAMKAQTRHQFVMGLGYIEHSAPPEIPATAKGGKGCHPDAAAADGSVHVLKPSHGAAEMKMRWVAAEKAWAAIKPGSGNRLAWTSDFLSAAGWEYVGPAGKKKAR